MKKIKNLRFQFSCRRKREVIGCKFLCWLGVGYLDKTIMLQIKLWEWFVHTWMKILSFLVGEFYTITHNSFACVSAESWWYQKRVWWSSYFPGTLFFFLLNTYDVLESGNMAKKMSVWINLSFSIAYKTWMASGYQKHIYACLWLLIVALLYSFPWIVSIFALLATLILLLLNREPLPTSF